MPNNTHYFQTITKKLGFTLIELLIVIALISILSAIAYPSYNQHLIKTRRNYAMVALMDLAGRMEEYFLLNNTYDNATLENLHVNNTDSQNYYHLAIAAKDDIYTLHAIPLGKQATADVVCGALTFDQTGKKAISGKGTVAECWY